MNQPSPLESSCFKLLKEALESLPVSLDQPRTVCSHICELVQKMTRAEAVMLLECDTCGEFQPPIVHPATWNTRMETTSARALLDLAVETDCISYWQGNDPVETVAPLLKALAVPNALVIPLQNGSHPIASLLALGIDSADPQECLIQAMQPLSKVLGLVLQGSLQHHPLPLPPGNVPSHPPIGEDRSRAIFDSVNDAILVQEVRTGAILDVNQRMCEMFGLTYDEALWMDMGSLSVGLPPCTQDEAWAWMRKAAEEGPQNFEWIAKHKSGHLFWIELNMLLANIEGRERLISTARDITDRKRTEAEQLARLKRSEAQNAVFLALAGSGLNYEAALELIAHHLAIQVGDLCVLSTLDEKAGLLHATAIDQPYIDGHALLPDYRTLPPTPIGSPGAGEVAQSGKALQVSDPSRERVKALYDAAFHPYIEHFGAHSLLIVPMRSQGKVIGTISLARCGASKPYSAEDAAMFQNLGDRSALTLVNARLYSENLQQAELLRQANADLEQRVVERTAELEKAMETLHRMAVEDTLTGIANRRRFNDVIEDEIRRGRRNQSPLSLLMCDVDFFKRYNDHYGHQGGDDCLRMVGAVMREVFQRAGDLPARYGGEEFAVVLPGLNAEQAEQVGEKLRKAIADRAMPHKASDVAPYVTLSIGTATAMNWTAEVNSDWFIACADEALYKSKATGRNRVTRG